MAYPVYLTIGNIPKDICQKPSHHAQILVGYIPTTKLDGMENKTGCRCTLANLFHSCMQKVLGPIGSVSKTGLEMMSGDGIWHRCHPIFAIFVGDYPKQALVTCTFNGQCPKCLVPCDQLGEYDSFPLHTQSSMIGIYRLADGDMRQFHQTCCEAGVKPVVNPFWASLPLGDIFVSITPDILHQMLQGMVKHLIQWLIGIFGPSVIDVRCKSIPPNHKILIFSKGITILSCVTGKEHKKICGFLLGLIIDLLVPGGMDSLHVVKAVCALLDFLFLAQFQSHTSDTLSWLEDSLVAFHNNKAIFVDLGIWEDFNIPKLHGLLHYCYDPGPYHQFSAIFPPFILCSQSLIPHSFPYVPLGPPPNHLTSHLMDHLTIPQSDITCHHSAVCSTLQHHHLTLYGLPAHYHIMMDCQLMMELYLELLAHDEPLLYVTVLFCDPCDPLPLTCI